MVLDPDALHERLQELVGQPDRPLTIGRDPVNVPMIRHLTDALGDRNPVYTDEAFAQKSVFGGIVAPPTSLQVWTMQGLKPPDETPGDADAERPEPVKLLDQAGYVGVVATNCEQTYHRYLRPGDLLTAASVIEEVSGLKKTALGEGFFITTLTTYRDQHGEVVGEQRFRILKFKPGTGRGAPEEQTGPPPMPREVAFFWEGVEAGELRIQRCASCGKLRHPPRPSCPWCQSFEWDHTVSSGAGTVFSFVVHHHPQVPNFEHPFTVALVELEEGTRIVGNVVDVDPTEVHVGMPVEVVFLANPSGRTLPQWRPAGRPRP